MMRRWSSIARATALEILSEPLSLLLLVAGVALSTLAPAFHYHQFGEATRMARDAGFSALFTSGLLVVTFGAVKTFRREIETGTAQMALAHPVSRTGFFLAKTLGVALAGLVFSAILFAALLTVVNGAAIGGALAEKSGDLARIWGPSLALGLSTAVVPLAVAAALNRFARFRFVLTFFGCAACVSLAGVPYRFDPALATRLLPVAVSVGLTLAVFLSAAAAFAVRLRTNGAAAAVGVLFAVCLPALGNYYLPEALSNGGRLPWSYVGLAAAAAAPAVLAFLLLGIRFFNGKDVA